MGSQEASATNFGVLIAYVLPGFTAIQGLPVLSGSWAEWGRTYGETSVTLPGILSGTIEAIAVGLTLSTIRWLLIDTLHHRTGIGPPAWDFALLDRNVAAFQFLVDSHYRYYKFYANMVVALTVAYLTGGYTMGVRGGVYLLLAALFLLASRDALRKYYLRAGRLLARDIDE